MTCQSIYADISIVQFKDCGGDADKIMVEKRPLFQRKTTAVECYSAAEDAETLTLFWYVLTNRYSDISRVTIWNGKN